MYIRAMSRDKGGDHIKSISPVIGRITGHVCADADRMDARSITI